MIRRLILLLVLVVSAHAEDLYCTQAGTTPFDGTLAHPFRASDFNTSGNWGAGAGKISAGDTVHLGGTFTTKLTVLGSGTNAATRITLMGDGTMTGSGAAMAWTGTTVLVGVDFGAFDYIAVLNCSFAQTSSANNYDCISIGGCDGWLIQGNYIHDTYYSGIATANGTTNTTGIIRYNLFYNVGGIGGGFGGGSNPANMSLRTNTTLVEYNTILRGMDRCNWFGSGDVGRNNYWGATKTSYYPLSPQYPSHNDAFQSHEAQGVALVQSSFSNNYDVDNTDDIGDPAKTNAHWMNVQDQSGVPLNFNWGLFRFNISIRPSGSLGDYIGYNKVYGYNNTFIACESGSTVPNTTPFFWHGTNASDISDWRNNTVSYSPTATDSGGIWGTKPTNYTSAKNHSFYNPAPNGQGVLPTGASPANLAQTDPGFTDGNGTAGHDNYTIGSGSLLHTAGSAAISTVAAGDSGSGTTLIVAAGTARRFFSGAASDGWAACDGDFLKVGSGAYVQITAVNVTTDTIALASTPGARSSGDSIYVLGSTDVGALPLGAGLAPSIVSGLITSVAGTATITVLDAFNVRFCSLEVDGIQVGTQFTPVGNIFTITWSGDSSPSHVFIARAFSQWASPTPEVDLQINVAAAATSAPALRNPAALGAGNNF